MDSGDHRESPKAEDQANSSPEDILSMEAQALPGYLPWERDLEMVSNFLDRKVEKL